MFCPKLGVLISPRIRLLLYAAISRYFDAIVLEQTYYDLIVWFVGFTTVVLIKLYGNIPYVYLLGQDDGDVFSLVFKSNTVDQ